MFKKVIFRSESVEGNMLGALLRNIRKGFIFSNLLRRPSIFPAEKLYSVICDLVPDRNFEDTKIPFVVPAIDVKSGTEVLLTKGSLRKALLASCSLPGFFPPTLHRVRHFFLGCVVWEIERGPSIPHQARFSRACGG